MKKFYLYSALFFLFTLLSNCICTRISEDQTRSARGGVEIDTTSMVIKYPSDMNDDEKAKFRKKYKFKTLESDRERCSCGDTNFELLEWDYDQFGPGEIQTAKTNLKSDPNAQSDEQFTMHVYPLAQDSDPYSPFPIKSSKKNPLTILQDRTSNMAVSGLLSNNTLDMTINIAVIDTGLNPEKLSNLGRFLYPTAGLIDGCEDQISGWNFVTDDKNTWDDHDHGTYVTRIIGDRLESEDIPFRILPIKAFSKEGKATYWHMVCAMNYVKKVNEATNNSIHIVNASFGYGFSGLNLKPQEMTQYKENSILKSLIEELGTPVNTIISASAGNASNNIDVVRESNFPASFPSTNLIGVGGYLETGNVLVPAGNSGPGSLELAAPYRFKFSKLILFKDIIEGSSFSTARNTAALAEIIYKLKKNGFDGASLPAAVRAILLEPEPNQWVDYHSGQLGNEVDAGRYIPQ